MIQSSKVLNGIGGAKKLSAIVTEGAKCTQSSPAVLTWIGVVRKDGIDCPAIYCFIGSVVCNNMEDVIKTVMKCANLIKWEKSIIDSSQTHVQNLK